VHTFKKVGSRTEFLFERLGMGNIQYSGKGGNFSRAARVRVLHFWLKITTPFHYFLVIVPQGNQLPYFETSIIELKTA
jgi:hypothetical protein